MRRNPRLALLLEDFRSERRGLRNRLPVQWTQMFQFFFERLTLLSKVYRWARRIARRFLGAILQTKQLQHVQVRLRRASFSPGMYSSRILTGIVGETRRPFSGV